jgi:SAM-dependent methyltransferase
MDVAAIRAILHELPYGKRLPTAIYLLDLDPSQLPVPLQIVGRELRRRFEIGTEYNVLKSHTDRPKISFLSYPDFLTNPHPALAAFVLVDLATGKVRRDDYRARPNPPVLHRKEEFLPPDHPLREKFATLTRAEEAAGLFAETDRIGFRLNWEKVLIARGVALRGHRLVTVEAPSADTVQAAVAPMPKVDRHRTALARTEASKPIKLLFELGQLRHGENIFDYGCGLGADIAALQGLGYEVAGWDPVHAPSQDRRAAVIANLGFVLNVIEDPAERVEVLANAWHLTQRLLVVSTLVRGQEGYSDFRCCGDGLMTSRNAFQKYFEPAELQAMIEDTLGCESVPVAMGIHFVFRRVDELQDFLSERSHRLIDWAALSHRLGLRKALRRQSAAYALRSGRLEVDVRPGYLAVGRRLTWA